MTGLVIVSVVVALLVILALAVTNPMMRKREDEAIAAVKDQLGTVELIEPRTTAMGTEPEEAGGVRGMACLGLDDAELVAVTWAGTKPWRIPRASVVGVDTPADDPRVAPKATITVTYARPEGGEATAMFRLRDSADWLTALGYDWGDEPAVGDDTAEEPGPNGTGTADGARSAGGPSLDKGDED